MHWLTLCNIKLIVCVEAGPGDGKLEHGQKLDYIIAWFRSNTEILQKLK